VLLENQGLKHFDSYRPVLMIPTSTHSSEDHLPNLNKIDQLEAMRSLRQENPAEAVDHLSEN
jgi:hypothetical protein